MPAFPSLIGDRYSMTITYPANSELPTGKGFTSNARLFFRPRYTFALGWSYRKRVDAEAFRDHVIQQTGGVLSFSFTTWKPWWWRFAQVGTGDGATVIFDFPGIETSAQQLFVRGTLLGANVTHGNGTNGSDRATLFAPPDTGDPIVASFFGKKIFTVVYADDAQPRIARDLQTGRYVVEVTLTSDRANGVRQ